MRQGEIAKSQKDVQNLEPVTSPKTCGEEKEAFSFYLPGGNPTPYPEEIIQKKKIKLPTAAVCSKKIGNTQNVQQ